jgi:NADH dehydrogenase FAD-containing subunit
LIFLFYILFFGGKLWPCNATHLQIGGYLQALRRDERILALGDCASLTIQKPDGTQLHIPAPAQSAYQQANLLGKSLARHIRHGNDLHRFDYKGHSSLVSLAAENTVGNPMGNLFDTTNMKTLLRA